MVKRVLTSIITVAVLMGVLVACGGSDSEVAELRAELEEVKAQLETEETLEREPTPVPPTPTPVPIVPEPTPQTFFEYPKYDIAVDFSTNLGTDKFSRLVDCRLDWESLLNLLELIETEAGIGEGIYIRDPNLDIDYIASQFQLYTGIWINDEDGQDLLGRLGLCYREFDEVFGPFTRFGDQLATPQMIYNYIDRCSELDRPWLWGRGNWESWDKDSIYFAVCNDERPTTEISKVNRAFKDLNDWSNEVLAVLNEE